MGLLSGNSSIRGRTAFIPIILKLLVAILQLILFVEILLYLFLLIQT